MSLPTIALLPFDDLSGDPGRDVFARGFVEDLALELARFATLEVIHPRSSAPGLRRAPAEAPGVPPAHDFELRGSVRRDGDAVRLGVQLVDTRGGRQLWADRFDMVARDLLATQEAIAAQVAAALAIKVDDARLAVARRRPLESLEVYDCWLRGRECLQHGTVESDAQARAFFERALALDPDWARAYAGLSLSHFNEWSCQAWIQWDEHERLAYEFATRAAALDDGDAFVELVLGRIHLYRREFEAAAHRVDRALALNPNDADVLAHVALCRAYLGDGASATALAGKAMRLNPRYGQWYVSPMALGLFVQGRYGEMIAYTLRVPQPSIDCPGFLAVASALSGDRPRAQEYLRRFLASFREHVTFGRDPDPGEPFRWLLHVSPFRRAEEIDRLKRGLELAGAEPDPDVVPAPPVGSGAGRAEFRRDGLGWRLAFEDSAVLLSETKGFHDLARLLAHPEHEFHCLELSGRPSEPARPDVVLDDRARREIQARVRELQQEIDEAEAMNDRARAGRAREELDGIVEVLSGALGLAGRSRTLGSPAERARSAVTWRIHHAIKKITAAHPRLGRHLENAVRTGTYCVYRPDRPVDWSL